MANADPVLDETDQCLGQMMYDLQDICVMIYLENSWMSNIMFTFASWDQIVYGRPPLREAPNCEAGLLSAVQVIARFRIGSSENCYSISLIVCSTSSLSHPFPPKEPPSRAFKEEPNVPHAVNRARSSFACPLTNVRPICTAQGRERGWYRAKSLLDGKCVLNGMIPPI